MDIERLKMWEAALVEATEKGRIFDFSAYARESADSPCGFTACLAGDLAMYPPAMELGLRVVADSRCGVLNFRSHQQNSAMRAFLSVNGGDERLWVDKTIIPAYATDAYGKPAHAVTRADGLARIRTKIKELETKSETA